MAPFKNIKIVSPITIKGGFIAGGVYIYYHQFSSAHKLRQQFDDTDQIEDNPITLCNHPSMTDLYILDPISLFLPDQVPEDVEFEGIIEYNPKDNSSFWWRLDNNAGSHEYPLESNKHVSFYRIYGFSLNPGFIISIINPKQKRLTFTLMGPENGIIGRTINIPAIIKQFNYIHPYWPELDMIFELTNRGSRRGAFLTFKLNGLHNFSDEPRIISVEKEFDSDVMTISETHIPDNTIITQLESL
jgi:hypothetical protein